MQMPAPAWASLLGAVLIATGCGTIMTVDFSMPYVGEAAPGAKAALSADSAYQMRYLSFRGVDLYVDLMNDIKTKEMVFMGFGETRYVPRTFTPGRHCIRLNLRPAIAGISVEPQLVSLSVNDAPRAAGRVERFVGTGFRSEEVTEARIPLAQGQWNRFQLCFPGESVTPDQNITLDLSRALRHPDNLPFPLIKFKMQRYRHLFS